MAVTIFAISVTIYNIFTNNIKCRKVYLENEDNGQKGGKLAFHHSTTYDSIYILDIFFRNFNYQSANVHAKDNIYTNSQ